jgi:hypothetical protein
MPQEVNNPFRYKHALGGGYVQAIDAESRLRMVKTFGPDELRAVIHLPGIQKTVREAAERRLKKLEGAR